jgi:outer membrane protein assembly factor BamB
LIHNQVGFQSSPAVVDGVVYTGCRDSQLYALDAETGKQKWKFDNALSWVITSPAVVDGKVFFATSDSSLFHIAEAASGKSLVKEDAKAYMFSSPAVTDDTVFIGVCNGTLAVRDRSTGALLWEFQTDASKANKGWALTAERRFNNPFLYFDNWREGPVAGFERQRSVGSIFSSPLVANGVVYFGSTDGYLYALE